MVSIIPLETNFPLSPSFEGPILHASYLGLTPALPKALQNLLHGVTPQSNMASFVSPHPSR